MATKYLDQNGLLYFWTKLKTLFGSKVDKIEGKGLSTNDYTTDEKTKLSGIEAGANAYTHPATHNADIIVDGSTNKAYTAAEKTKLAGIAANANAYTHPAYTSKAAGLYKVSVDATGHVSAATAVAKADITELGIPAQDTVYTHPETHSADMIADGTTNKAYTTAEKNKLAGIATGATANAASATAPKMNGSAAVGSEANYARGDHIHPTDTTRAPLASPTFTGTPAAPTAATGTNTTQIATTAFVTAAISTAIGGITGMSYEVVASLPASGAAGKVYLLSHGGTAPEVYDEYIWIGSAWEKIGTTAVDLSGYVQTTDLTAVTNAEIDVVVAS